jgi:hypothetical protein
VTDSTLPFPDILRPVRRARGSAAYTEADPSGRSILERFLQLWQASERLASANGLDRPDEELARHLRQYGPEARGLAAAVAEFARGLAALSKVSPTRISILCDPAHPRMSVAEQRHQILRKADLVRAARSIPLDNDTAAAAAYLLRCFRNAAVHAAAVTTDTDVLQPVPGACALLDECVCGAYSSAFQVSRADIEAYVGGVARA